MIHFKSIFYISLIFSFCAAHASVSKEVKYSISRPAQSSSTCVKVSVESQADNTGDFYLNGPAFGSGFTLHSKSHFKFDNMGNKGFFKLTFAPNERFEFNYQLCIDNFQRDLTIPIIETDKIHFVANNLLATPYDKSDDSWDIDITFENMLPGQMLYTSYGPFDSSIHIVDNIRKFGNAAFSLDKFKVYNSTIQGENVSIITSDEWESLSHNYLKNLLGKLVSYQRKFWGESGSDEYVLALFKELDTEFQAINGIHNLRFLSITIPEMEPEKLQLLKYAASHEIFHHWMGDKVTFTLPQVYNQWFVEGFTDYFGLRLSFDSQLMTQQEYIDVFNKLIKYYFLLPANTISLSDLAIAFGHQSPLSVLPQYQGHMVATHLNALHTQNPNIGSIDALMAKIYADNKKSGSAPLSSVDLERFFVEYYGEDIWGPFRDKIRKGEMILPHPQALGPSVRMVEKTEKLSDYGFDMKKFFIEKKIKDLSQQSSAYQAGLREGDSVVSYDIDVTASDSDASITVKQKEASITYTFKPGQREVKIPMYEMVEAS